MYANGVAARILNILLMIMSIQAWSITTIFARIARRYTASKGVN